MTLFTDADLADFGALAVDLALKDDCEILRETSESTDAGGGSSGSETTFATVKCAVIDSGQSPTEQVMAQQLEGRVIKQILLPRLTAIRKSDILRVSGTRYHIIDSLDPTSYEVLRRVSVWREE